MNNDIKIPNHVGIILDGNGRWAKERGLPRSKGHDAGFKNLQKLVPYVFNRGVKVLSIYVFSTENFNRDKEEVDHLMKIFVNAFNKELKRWQKENIKVVFSGRDEPLSKEVISARDKIIDETKNNTKGILNICLNYGGQYEIVDMVKKIISLGIKEEEVNINIINKYLYNDLPSIDLLIRTSGELRLSNFMLFQNAYAEFYFPKTYFPDFNELEFDKAIMEYNNRDRRFGGTNN